MNKSNGKSPPAKTTVIDGITIAADAYEGPFEVDGCDTIAKLFKARTTELGERTAHREKHLGIWRSFTWTDYYNAARKIGLGLLELGLKRGDVVSILSEDNKEWLYCDLGTQCAGGISSGIYTTDSPEQVAFLVTDSNSKFLFVENDEMLDKYLEVADQTDCLNKVIVYERDGLHDFSHDKVMFLDELMALGQKALDGGSTQFEDEIEKSAPEEVALLVYTSGTTGKPKGAMITNSNVMAAMTSFVHVFEAYHSDEQLCFLPLCHILERNSSGYIPILGKSTVNFAESTETVFDNLQEVKPTVFTAVPRVWEKIFSGVSILVNDGTKIGKMAYGLAVKAGLKRADYLLEDKPVPFAVEAQYRLWDFLVLANLRRMIGLSRIRRAGTGAAPISPDLIRWYRAIGVNLLEGYGQTEGSGLTSINQLTCNKHGTVGPAIPGIRLRIADDGEIQFKGGNVFEGYWNAPDKTRETITDDGYLRTGDIGFIDNEGFLSITGRLKDIIITAGGKNITPAEIENKLKFSPYISDAVVIGDKRKYLTCLIMIDQENVEKLAQDRRIPFNNFQSLCAAKPVQELIRSIVDETNKSFARVEQIKDFRLIDILLTAEDEELTATMKLKRGYVEKRHADLIDQMY